MTKLDFEARQLLLAAPDLLDGKPPAQLVTVFDVRGSAPRAPGARLLCRDGVLLGGTIGGGRLEEQAILHAAALAATPSFTSHLQRYDLGPQLAQCCGGVVELLTEHFDDVTARARRDELLEAERNDLPLQTSCGDRTLFEHPDPSRVAVIFGAGHVGTALAMTLSVLPWRVIVIDARPQWANPARFAASVEVICAEPAAVLAGWGWLGATARAAPLAANAVGAAPAPQRAFGVVMTHDHGVDRDIIDALLRVSERTAGPALRYVGVIGSKTKIATLRRRILERGATEAQLSQLVAPIGLRLDGALLGSKLPGEIAISVAAQLLSWPDMDASAS